MGQLGYYTQSSESGSSFLQLGVRFYDAGIGRFTQGDPVGDGTDWYAYGFNDPVSFYDPNGQEGRRLWPPGLGDDPPPTNPGYPIYGPEPTVPGYPRRPPWPSYPLFDDKVSDCIARRDRGTTDSFKSAPCEVNCHKIINDMTGHRPIPQSLVDRCFCEDVTICMAEVYPNAPKFKTYRRWKRYCKALLDWNRAVKRW